MLILVIASLQIISNAMDTRQFKGSRQPVPGFNGVEEKPRTVSTDFDKLKAPNYQKGLKSIKNTIDALLKVPPRAGPFGENHYNRHIHDDSEKILKGELPLTSEILSMYLQLSDKELEVLKKSHNRAMRILPNTVVPNAFTGRGIVTTGGGQYFPMVLTAIRWVREQDPDIPIEVFMLDASEYEKGFCEDLFPSLNVECIVAEQVYGKKLSRKLVSGFALKPLALLTSKFDDIYFMDADSFPLKDINEIFDWDLYQEVGYILNRDYWSRTVSPHYYEVADHPLGERIFGNDECGVLLQADRKDAVISASTESGQIFINKSKHIRSLMLAMYYNLYGDGVYFPLLTMGGPGEGDKDTYASAAVICYETFFQTDGKPETLGQWHKDKFHGYVMLQPDPRDDYLKYSEGINETTVHAAQLHSSSLKANIRYLLKNSKNARGYPSLRKTRFFGNMSEIRKKTNDNVDVELRFFDAMRYVACNWVVRDNYVPRDWQGQDTTQFCRILTAHTKYLKGNPTVPRDDDKEIYWLDLDEEELVPEVAVENQKT